MAITDGLLGQWDVNTRGRSDDDFYNHVTNTLETSNGSPAVAVGTGSYEGLVYTNTDTVYTKLTWPAGLSGSFPAGAFTMAVRVKVATSGSASPYFGANSGGYGPPIYIEKKSSNLTGAIVGNNTQSVMKYLNGATSMTNGTEHVFTLRHNGSGSLKYWLDGVSEASATGAPTSGISGLVNLTLGGLRYGTHTVTAVPGSGTTFWAAIWNRELSDAEIIELSSAPNPFDVSPEVTFDDDAPLPGDTIVVTASPDFDSTIESMTFPNGQVLTPSSATSGSATFTMPAKSQFLHTADFEDTKWGEPLTVAISDGTTSRNTTLTFTIPSGTGIYSGVTGATPYPEDNRFPSETAGGDFYFGEYLAGAGTLNEYGVASQSELPSSLSIRIFDESLGLWSGEYIYNFALTDTTPSAYAIPDITDAEVSVVYTSEPFTPVGYNADTTISIVGGTYSVNGGIYTASSGSLSPGDSVRVRNTSSDSYNTTVTTTVTIGGVTSDFEITTKQLSYDVNPFTIDPVSGVSLNTGVESDFIYPEGYNVPVPVSIINGQFSIDGDPYTSSVTDIPVGSNIKVKAVSSSQYDTAVTAILTVGDQSANFVVTTEAAQLIPDVFTFQGKDTIQVGTAAVTSDPIAITGINSSVPVFVSGSSSAQYSKNDGEWTSAAGVAVAGDIFRVRVNASEEYNSQTTASLTVGGVTATFSVTTLTESQAVTGGYKIKLETVDSGYMTTELLNDNMTKVQENLNDKVLYRLNPDGTPNEMHNNIDMNGYRILNLPEAVNTKEPITFGQALEIIGSDKTPVYGYAESTAIWYKGSNNGPWVPEQTFADINVQFVKANAVISTVVVRVILDANTGNLNATRLAITGEVGTVSVVNNNTSAPRITVTHTESGVTVPVIAVAIQGGAKGDDGADGADGAAGEDGVTTNQYYIRPVYGTAIKNGVGTLTIQARVLTASSDLLLSFGDAKLYVDGTEVTEANGYAAGSDGYTGVFDTGDINGSVLVELKNLTTGVTYDSITLVDIEDGVASNATTGSVAPTNGLAWTRAKNDGAWAPTQAYTDLVATFYQGGSAIATETRRVTLNTSTGALTEALQGSDHADIDVTTSGSGTGAITISFEHTPSGHVIAETVLSAFSGNDGSDGSDGADGADGENATLYYIKPTNGTAIKNGVGSLTIEARKVDGTSDTLLSSGTIKLYSGSTEITQANGFVQGSNGYTGIFDADDINDSIVVELKNGPSGTVLDTITLIDITDGIGSNATTGSIVPSNGLAWNRAKNDGAWSPGVTTTDLVATFYQGGSAIASETQRVTLNTSAGTLTSAMVGSNHADISVSVSGSGTNTITVSFTHVPSGAIVSEQVIAVQGGTKGDTGNAGTPGADAVLYYIKPTTGTAIKNGVGTVRIEAHKVTGGTDTALTSGTVKLYVGTTEVTAANGYYTGSTGYVGIFDAGDINEAVVVVMKDGANGTVLDSITLIDVTDGSGSNATYGSVAPSHGLAWSKPTGGSWTPTNTYTDLVCTFYQGGSAVATETRRVTLNTSTGVLTSALQGTDNANITASIVGSGTSVLTVTFTHTPSGAKVSETVISQLGSGTTITRIIVQGNNAGEASTSFTTHGGSVSLRVTGTLAGTGSAPGSELTMLIKRGATTIQSIVFPVTVSTPPVGGSIWTANPTPLLDTTIVDAPAAGTYTYSVDTTGLALGSIETFGTIALEVIEYVTV